MKIEGSWKKLTVTILGILAIAASTKLGLTELQTSLIAGMVGTYMVGQGLADFGKEKKG